MIKMWQSLQAAEGTFFEQSETVADHITKLEQIVERIEHPAHRAIDEALEVAFDRGQVSLGLGFGFGFGLGLELRCWGPGAGVPLRQAAARTDRGTRAGRGR